MTELIKCIYCDSEKSLTKSDIIPDAITTAKCTNKNVCKQCNNLTNKLHEQKFAMDFSFIRNKLGYTSRRNNELVPFKMDIWVNEKPSLRKKPSFTKNFYSPKKFIDDELLLASDGTVTGFKNAPPKYKTLINPKIQYLYQIDYKRLFFSNSTIRTIAKIGYEWHCKMNNINSKMLKYDRLRNYILNNGKNTFVEIIDDQFFENHTKHFFGYVEGAHALFEYTDNQKRYVVFSLFGIVWYRILICKEYSKNFEPTEMHQFLLDREVKVQKSNAMGIDILGDQRLIKNYFLNPKTIKIHKIKVSHTKNWEEKLKGLLSNLRITYYEVARLVKAIDGDGMLAKCNSSYFIDLLNYQENRKIMGVVILHCLNGLKYSNDISFNENLKNIDGKILNNLIGAKEFILKNIEDQSKFELFMQTLIGGKKVFDSITRAC